MEQEEKLCDEVETVSEFTYLGDRVNVCEACKAAVHARTRFGWARSKECNKLSCGKRFPLRLKMATYKTYIRPPILYGCEAWHMKEGEMLILRWTEKSMVKAMCGVQLKDRTRSKDSMLGLNETIDQLAMVNSVCWYDHVLRREDGDILRRALDFEDIEGQ